ncbi:MAG: carbon-nitrogen hydrolase, partial [Pseudomonadota bacterium]
MEMRTVEPAAAEKAAEARPALPASVRVTAVQFALSACETRAAFYARIERFAAAAAAYESDFVVFPEHFTFAMLPSEGRMLAPAEAMDMASI